MVVSKKVIESDVPVRTHFRLTTVTYNFRRSKRMSSKAANGMESIEKDVFILIVAQDSQIKQQFDMILQGVKNPELKCMGIAALNQEKPWFVIKQKKS
jgi:hypothetical protein